MVSCGVHARAYGILCPGLLPAVLSVSEDNAVSPFNSWILEVKNEDDADVLADSLIKGQRIESMPHES